MGDLLSAYQLEHNIRSPAHDEPGRFRSASQLPFGHRISSLADLDEISPVDDAYMSIQAGMGTQPPNSSSVVAGLVAASRLHILLEKT